MAYLAALKRALAMELLFSIACLSEPNDGAYFGHWNPVKTGYSLSLESPAVRK